MKNTKFKRVLMLVLALVMTICVLPMTTYAAAVGYVEEEDDFYKVVSQKEWELAPGITEAEIVINNDAGDRRQVMHVVEVDPYNEYTKVIPSSKGMIPTPGKYGVETMDKQAAFAEANGYGNVVAAMNISLSWYDSAYYDQHPELAGEPLGYLILDGVQYTNSQGKTSGAATCLVINFDEKNGEARPADMPKTQIRSTSDPITGWEEQVIPANFGFLVKDGKMVNTKEEHTSEGASRSMLGIKEDGTIVMVMNDGRQAPYSTGFNNYEMSEAMLKLGCVYAINGDGGGSSQFLSQRPGEELTVNCSPSDGALRATTHGVLVISTAPSTGEFVRAHVEAEHEYYTPGSTVQFKAIGTDLAGGAADIPADAYWQLSDDSMGTIDEDGIFVSNGKAGEVTAQLMHNGEVKGSATIQLVVPDAISFGSAEAFTVPFGESVTLSVTATYGVFDVALKAEDYTISAKDTTLGTVNGNKYTAGETAGTTDITVTLNADTSLSKTVPLTVGKGSEVIFSFEEGTAGADLNNWLIKDHEGKYAPYSDLSIVTSETGMVHNGDTALAVHMPTHERVSGGEGYNANSITWVGDPILLENATSIGMWIYIPEEATQSEIALNYVWYNDKGVQQRTTPDLCLNDTFNGMEYSGWHYLSVPIAKPVAYIEDAKDVAASQGYKRNFFLKFYVTNSGNAGDESSYMGDITYYIDDVTVDYSDAVADRVAPKFTATNVYDINSDVETALSAGETLSVNSKDMSFTAAVTDNVAIDASSAKVYVDGKAISATYKNGRINGSDITLGSGVHRVVYEIADTMGNVSKAVRYIEVAGTDVAVNVVPHNADATVALTGSVYWVDVVASEAEKVEEITLKLDLDTMHNWEVEFAELAYGYSMETYYASVADEKDNALTVVLSNNGSDVSGNTVLASIPVRVWSYCGNAEGSSVSPAQAWTNGSVPAVSVNVEVEQGEVMYADGSIETFSAEKMHIDTEAYIHQYKMDKTYYANNTYHVHTAEAIADKEATCTANGYENRTYCDVCDSVVEWGTVLISGGHDVSSEDGLNICSECGCAFYYLDGEAQTGWIEVDGNYYYCDASGKAVTGNATVDGHTYTFTDYVLTDGAWEHDGVGLTCWWAGELINGPTYDTHWRTINGNKYYFNNIYVNTGMAKTQINTSGQWSYYMFDENGVWLEDYNGVNNDYIFKNGVNLKRYQLAEYDGNFYFVNDGDKIAKDVKLNLSQRYVEGKTFADGTAIPAGVYYFDAEGKMVIEEKTEEVKNGVYGDYLYKDGVIVKRYQLAEYDGNFYFVNDGDKIAKDVKLNLSQRYVEGKTFADGTAIPAGVYYFDAEGKMVIEEKTEEVKNGVYGDYLYKDGVIVKRYQLAEYDGNFYFVNDGDKIAKDVKLNLSQRYVEGKTFADGTAIPAGVYYFDAEGKMVIEDQTEEVKNGVYGDYLYIEGVKMTRYQLVEYDGNFYFVNDGDKIAKDVKLNLSQRYVEGKTFADGTAIPAGVYYFDAEGQMIIN